MARIRLFLSSAAVTALARPAQAQQVETVALFGDACVGLSDRLALIGRFRLDHERNRYPVETVATSSGAFPNVTALGRPMRRSSG